MLHLKKDKISKRGSDREILEGRDSESVVIKRVYKSVTKDVLNNRLYGPSDKSRQSNNFQNKI